MSVERDKRSWEASSPARTDHFRWDPQTSTVKPYSDWQADSRLVTVRTRTEKDGEGCCDEHPR